MRQIYQMHRFFCGDNGNWCELGLCDRVCLCAWLSLWAYPTVTSIHAYIPTLGVYKCIVFLGQRLTNCRIF